MSIPDAGALYDALTADPSRLRAIRRLTYRCASRCLLLDAIEVPEPGRILMHQNRYKLSHDVNQRRSSKSGRAKNTFDGDRHWKAPGGSGSYYVGTSGLAHPEDGATSGLALQCDHVGVLPDGSILTLSAPAFHADWHAGHTEITVRPDGSRFAVR